LIDFRRVAQALALSFFSFFFAPWMFGVPRSLRLCFLQRMRHPQGQLRKPKGNQLRRQLPQWYHPVSRDVNRN
jgi:hypothetical protein